MRAVITVDAIHETEYDALEYLARQKCIASTTARAVEKALAQMCGCEAKNIICKIEMIEPGPHLVVADLKRTRADENPD